MEQKQLNRLYEILEKYSKIEYGEITKDWYEYQKTGYQEILNFLNFIQDNEVI